MWYLDDQYTHSTTLILSKNVARFKSENNCIGTSK